MNSHQAHYPESPTGHPGAQAGPEQPTVYEFLTRLATDETARTAFDADPQGSLDRAGLGDMNATDVSQATSLVLDYAPVEIVDDYHRTLQSSVDQFTASTQHVAIDQLHSTHPHEQEEPSMLQNSPEQEPDFSEEGDVDEQLPPESGDAGNQGGEGEAGDNIDLDMEQNDSQNLINVHDVANDNNIANIAGGDIVGGVGDTVGGVVGSLGDTVGAVGDTVNNTVGAVGDTVNNTVDNTVGDVTNTVDNTVDNTVGDTVDNTVGDVGNTVDNTVGDTVDNTVGDVAGGDLANDEGGEDEEAEPKADEGGENADPVGGVTEPVGDVAGDAVGTATGTAGDVAGTATETAGDAPVVGDVAEPVGEVAEPVEDVAGDLPVDDVAGDLPVDDLANTAPEPADVPVVGDVTDGLPTEDVTGPVEDTANHLPEPSDVPVAGDVAGDTVEQVSGDLELDGLL